MSRKGDFSNKTKKTTIERQGGVCAFCGVNLDTRWSNGEFKGYAHHLKPIIHGGSDNLDNCVYLCWGHHLLIGHGMAPFGIDKQWGSSDTWVQIERDEFPYWNSLNT